MRRVFVLLAAASLSGYATAQESPDQDGLGLTLGAGGLVAPAYEGDDSYRLSILPNIQVTYGDKFFASIQEGIGFTAIDTSRFRAGPIGRIKFSRSEDGDQPFAVTGDDTEDLRGLGEIDASFELGGFIEYRVGPISLGVEARKAVSGHNGFVADMGVSWAGRSSVFGSPVIWSIGPRIQIVDDTYNRAYFGVDASQSLASGLPEYSADGGIYSYGIGATAIAPLTRDNRWSAVMFAGYGRLSGDAASSPLVQLRGSEDQASVGVFVSYRVL